MHLSKSLTVLPLKQAAFLHSYTTKNRDIYQSFHRAEEQMKQVLKARKAEIKVSYCLENYTHNRLGYCLFAHAQAYIHASA